MNDNTDFEAGWNAAMLAEAKACDEIREEFDRQCRKTYDPLDAGTSDGAWKCAVAIRRMIKAF